MNNMDHALQTKLYKLQGNLIRNNRSLYSSWLHP